LEGITVYEERERKREKGRERKREKEKTQSTTLLSSEIGGGRKFVCVGFRRSE